MILVFSVSFHTWGLPSLPSGGAYDPVFGGDVGDRLIHLVMPAIVLATLYIATWSRYVRTSLISVLSRDYIRTARAKGMRERRVIYVHALRNALMPLATLVGLELPRLFSGTLVVEVVFGWPGIGQFSYQRALQYDYSAVLGVSAFVAILVVLGNLLADLSYAVIDPRLRRS
jgi:peptide/nickel transport system permease protein